MTNPIRYVLAHLPGWNSLDAVDRLSTYSSWFAIIGGLGLLMILELVAHVYAGRKEELVAISHAAEIAGLKSEREEAVKKLVVRAEEKVVQDAVAGRLAAASAARTIDSITRQRMQGILIPLVPAHIKIRSYDSNPESFQFAHAIADVFKASGWVVDGPHVGLLGTGPTGIWLQVPRPEGSAPILPDQGLRQDGMVSIDALPPPAKQVMLALAAGKIQDVNYAEISDLKLGDLELYVGAKVLH